MAATTVTRESMTDNVTVWNVVRIGSSIYDRIDAILAGAVTFGGVVSSEGFGTHTFSASGTGGNVLQIRNPTAGTSNFGSLDVGNNSSATLTRLLSLASTYTTAGYLVQDGTVLAGTGAGGLSLVANNAAGDIRLYTGGSATLRLTISDSGAVSLGTSTNMDCGVWAYNSADDAGVTNGATIDFDTEIFDEGGNFAADTFTAPVTGRYYLSAGVALQNVTGGAIDMGAFIATSNRASGIYLGYQSGVANNGQLFVSGSAIVDMDASDVAVVKYEGTGNATVRGSGTLSLTWFSARRVL